MEMTMGLCLPAGHSPDSRRGYMPSKRARGLKKPKNCKFVCFLVRAPSVRFLETVPFDPQVTIISLILSWNSSMTSIKTVFLPFWCTHCDKMFSKIKKELKVSRQSVEKQAVTRNYNTTHLRFMVVFQMKIIIACTLKLDCSFYQW